MKLKECISNNAKKIDDKTCICQSCLSADPLKNKLIKNFSEEKPLTENIKTVSAGQLAAQEDYAHRAGELLRQKNFSIVRSARLCIHHELMAKKGRFYELKKLQS